MTHIRTWALAAVWLLLAAAPLHAQWLVKLEEDRKLGEQVVKEIASKPEEYPLVDEQQYPQAYAYLRGMVNTLLASGNVRYAKDFQWEVYLINKDVKNAFCAPGGKIYVYTGLIRYLGAEHELAGVLGHEIAHADLRHTARQMEKNAGVQLLAAVGAQLAGGGQLAGQVAGGLAGVVGLRFSRSHEREADRMSVSYLCNTPYRADGAAAFFEKIRQEQGGNRSLEFLSTHPDPGNRIDAIRREAQRRNCGEKPVRTAEYEAFVRSLPPLPPK